jgi:hypothetical protein
MLVRNQLAEAALCRRRRQTMIAVCSNFQFMNSRDGLSGMQVSFWTWYHGTKIINDTNAFKGYVGLVVVFLLDASLPLGTSGTHASRHTIINLRGGSNNYCSY